MSELALVVVIHDSAPELELLLRSLRHLPSSPQLVVVDSGSRDDGATLAAAAGAEVVHRPDNPGFGAATNEGLRRVRAGVTALVNPDVELLDDGLERLSSLARERDRLFAPRLLNRDGTIQRSAHPRPGTIGSLLPAVVHPPLLPFSIRVRVEPWRARRPRTVGWAIAACLVARTGTLRRLGPFDERIFLFHEDLDLGLRARAAGVATELRPEVALRHAGAHATEVAFGGEPFEEIARRRREVIERDLGPGALRVDDAGQAATFATRAVGRTLLGRPAERPRAQLRGLRAARRR